MARETLASKQAIIDGLQAELVRRDEADASLRDQLRELVGAPDPQEFENAVKDVVREFMHTDEATEYVESLAEEAIRSELGYDGLLDASDVLDIVRDEFLNMDAADIGAAEEDHSHEVR